MPQPSWPMNGSVMWAVCEPSAPSLKNLTGPTRKTVVALARAPALGDRELEVGVARALGDAQPQGAVGVHLGVGRARVLAVDVGDARQADREQPVLAALEPRPQRRLVVRDDVEQVLSRLAQDARGLARRVAHDLAADRVGGVARDAGALQRKGVRPDRVAVDARQRGDPVARHRVEGVPVGLLRDGPAVVVPAAAVQPLALGQRSGVGPDELERLLQRPRLAQVDGRQVAREPLGVDVGVVQAGHDEGAGQVDDVGRPSPRRRDGSTAAPTATTRPSSTSSASVQGFSASPVQMRSCRKSVRLMRWAPG